MTRILLVEGNEGEAQALDRTLRTHGGWSVTRAGTLLEAIRAAGDTTFDAAVVDTELPDGSGLDILDFLRIGSPNIRILLLSAAASESVAFHALSHGAGDFLVKDAHLDQELPRRMDALLDAPDAVGALVETITPVRAYDVRETRPPLRAPVEAPRALEAALTDILEEGALAAGVWDLRGKVVGTKSATELDGDGVGFALATLHGQVGALWTYGAMKPTGYRMLIDVDDGVLAITAIPGTYVVALLFPPGIAPRAATDRLDRAAHVVLAALQSGASSDA